MSEPSVEFRCVSLDYLLPSEGDITSFKEWAIRRITQKISYRRMRALDDISFSLPPGRAIGLIGHNGAGKSTLLRVAAGILQPSEGVAVMRGLMAPVIELGTGFEFELSGRENIFFNGALLGRSWEDMNARVDEIIEFAELADFIDNPIRTYSTGMVARLAFSIATTVDAQILLLDEVLSVGDQRFRAKCDARMSRFRDEGVTIMLVSHDLDAIARVCDEVLWLDHGKIKAQGEARSVVREYAAWVARQDGHPSGEGNV